MTTAEAYDHTREVIEDLRATGIIVHIKPSSRRDNAELVAKYSGPERIAPEKWVNVSFLTTPVQSAAVAQAAKELGWMGITFDTGGMLNHRDWELDWSFAFRERQPDGEREMMRDTVEHMISTSIEGGQGADSGRKDS